MRLRHFLALVAAISFMFVLSTQDLCASQNSKELFKQQNDESKIYNRIDQDIQMQLLKSDVILGNEDGGGYYRAYDYTWLWITLVVTVILVVILIVAYSSDWWWWY